MAKNQAGDGDAGKDRAPGGIDFRDGRKGDVVQRDSLRRGIGRGVGPAAVSKGEGFDGGRAEGDRHISITGSGTRVGVAELTCDDLIEAGEGASGGVRTAGRNGRRDERGAVDRKSLDRADLILKRATTKIDVEKGERNVIHARSVEGGKVHRHDNTLALICEIDVEDK